LVWSKPEVALTIWGLNPEKRKKKKKKERGRRKRWGEIKRGEK
jgi:hypothetical protein